MARLKIFNSAKVNALHESAAGSGDLSFYRDGSAPPAMHDDDLLETTFDVEEPPVLDPARARGTLGAAEIQNARALHSWLQSLDHVAARDERLWVYLTHVVFPAYCRNRWPVPDTDAARANVEHHWFARGTKLRVLRRNALARLWWAAELTRAPWEDDSLADLGADREDPWLYTGILLGLQDMYQVTVERDFGSDRKILLAFLEVSRSHPEECSTGLAVKRLAKELNLLCTHRDLGALPILDVVKEIEALL